MFQSWGIALYMVAPKSAPAQFQLWVQFSPVLELGRVCLNIGTEQLGLHRFLNRLKTAQFQNGMPYYSTRCPMVTQCEYGDVRIPVPTRGKNWSRFQHWASANMGANT